MEVWSGGTRFSVGIFGVPVAVDPGPHKVEVRAEGFETWSTTVNLKASERRAVAVPTLRKHEAPTKQVHITSRRGPLFTAGVITAGVGVASIALGALLGAAALRGVRNAEADDSLCGLDKTCTPEGIEAIEAADDKAIASTATFAIGGIGVLAGFVMVLLDPGSTREAVSSATVVPTVGPDGAGLGLKMRF